MAYEAAYRTWQRTQTHRLASEANKRLVAFEAALDEPVAPNLIDSCGEYSDCARLKYDVVSRLPIRAR